MKIDRLISIIVVLLRRERVQAKELAEIFDVSVRTILRDVEAINMAGIPIVTFQGANGGIGIAEGYRLDKNVLSADDLAAIITTLRGAAGSIPDRRYGLLMEKLQIPLSATQLETLNQKTQQMIIDLSPWGGNGINTDKIPVIRQAIESHQELEFYYRDVEGKKTRRRAEPYSLILKGQNWYLYAWCLLREDFRLFKLSRIRELIITEGSFVGRELPETSSLWENEWINGAGLIELELLFEPELETLVEEFFEEESVWQIEGKFLVKVFMPENNWLYGWLLSFGPKMEVLSPGHVREGLADIAAEIFNKYASEPDI